MRTNDVVFTFLFIVIFLLIMGLTMVNNNRFYQVYEIQEIIINNQSKIIEKLERKGLSIPDKQTEWKL